MDGEKAKLKEKRYNSLYIDLATRISDMSYAERLHVGAVIVKNDNIISFGWNGMPSGWDNNCEYEVTEFQTEYGVGSKLVNTGELKTRPEVSHAEQNAIAKLAKSTESGMGATMFITHAPCLDCAKLIYQSGISSVLYRNTYRDIAGVVFLKNSGIEVEQV
jgi:dCMP deaminase